MSGGNCCGGKCLGGDCFGGKCLGGKCRITTCMHKESVGEGAIDGDTFVA